MIASSQRLPDCHCLGCGRLVDAAACVDDETLVPSSGDVTVCLYCGHLMAYDGARRLRALTPAEQIAVAGDRRILAIQRARGKLARTRPDDE